MTFNTPRELAGALRLAKDAHHKREQEGGTTAHEWPEWYGNYMFNTHKEQAMSSCHTPEPERTSTPSLVAFLAVIVLLIVGILVITGCDKQGPLPSPTIVEEPPPIVIEDPVPAPVPLPDNYDDCFWRELTPCPTPKPEPPPNPCGGCVGEGDPKPPVVEVKPEEPQHEEKPKPVEKPRREDRPGDDLPRKEREERERKEERRELR